MIFIIKYHFGSIQNRMATIFMTIVAVTIRDITRSTVVIWVKHFHIEFMVEIYSKSVVRAIGKVFCMKLT